LKDINCRYQMPTAHGRLPAGAARLMGCGRQPSPKERPMTVSDPFPGDKGGRRSAPRVAAAAAAARGQRPAAAGGARAQGSPDDAARREDAHDDAPQDQHDQHEGANHDHKEDPAQIARVRALGLARLPQVRLQQHQVAAVGLEAGGCAAAGGGAGGAWKGGGEGGEQVTGPGPGRGREGARYRPSI
jgi:hypothetical protein